MMKKTAYILLTVFLFANSYAEASFAPVCAMPMSAMACCQGDQSCCELGKPISKPLAEAPGFQNSLKAEPKALHDAAVPSDLFITEEKTYSPDEASLKSPPKSKLYRLHSDYRI